MCGLAGYLSTKKLTKAQADKRKNIYRGLLISMQTRGSHSTGVAGFNSGVIDIYKKKIPAEEFVKTKGYKKILNNNSPILIGHTRYATSGAISDRNAHPFEIGDIVGTHNGWLFSFD